jgi:uncharacterized RDD family membrane protein YckC
VTAWVECFGLSTKARQHLDQAYAHEDEGRPENALRECELAIQLAPDWPAPDWAEAHNCRGIVLDELGRQEEAIQAYREAVRLDPAFRKARENLIEAEAELRQRKEALATDAVRPATRSKGFHMRAGAYIIDVCIQFAINAIMGLVAVIVFSPLLAAGSNQFYNPFLLRFLGFSCLSQVLFVFLYFPIFEWLFGASPGKLILGMRVVQEDGRPCTLKAAVIRGLARLVDQLLSANVAFFQMAKTPLRQRYGDKAANTLVVDHKDALIQRLRPWWWFLIAAISYLGLQGILAGLLVKDTLGSGW